MTAESPPDLTGRRFGKWTVIGKGARRFPGSHPYWLCECECKTKWSVRGTALLAGESTQCRPCSGREKVQLMVRAKDLTGLVFGKWSVIERAHLDPGRKRHWLCECTCGTRKTVEGSSLRRGMSKGCRRCGSRFKPDEIKHKVSSDE